MKATLSDFYYVDSKLDGWRYLRVSERAGKRFSKSYSEAGGGTWGGPGPLPLMISQGSKSAAWVKSDTGLRVVTDEFVSVLKEAGCDGYEVKPVVIYDRNDDKIVDHAWHLVTSVGAGPIDMKRGKPTIGSGGGPDGSIVGVFFDPATWTGRDVFCLSDWKVPIFSKRAGEALLRAKLSGIYVEPCPLAGTWAANKFPAFFGPRKKGLGRGEK